MDYKQKYLKYKQKYMLLKQLGGVRVACTDLVRNVKKEVKIIKLALKFAKIDRTVNKDTLQPEEQVNEKDIAFMATLTSCEIDRIYEYVMKPSEINEKLKTHKFEVSKKIGELASKFGAVKSTKSKPKVIEPVKEIPKVEEPIVEEVKVEETPVEEAPVVEAPVVKASKVEVPEVTQAIEETITMTEQEINTEIKNASTDIDNAVNDLPPPIPETKEESVTAEELTKSINNNSELNKETQENLIKVVETVKDTKKPDSFFKKVKKWFGSIFTKKSKK